MILRGSISDGGGSHQKQRGAVRVIRSLKWMFGPRYFFHRLATEMGGDKPLSRFAWMWLIVRCDYTARKSFCSYGPVWKFWRWVIFRRVFIVQAARVINYWLSQRVWADLSYRDYG
jgi:hypothetical protein